MVFIMLGAPGSGKGTQAMAISAKLHIPRISTGDIFRKNISEDTPLGKIARQYIDEGKLVPDDLTIEIVKNRITEEDCRDGFILDGFPRTIEQAVSLDTMLSALGKKVDRVLNLEVEDDVILHRLTGRRACISCGATYHTANTPPKKTDICDLCGSSLVIRDDDKPETIQMRLVTYHTQSRPLITYYRKQGNLETYDGRESVEKITEEILKPVQKT